jgi:hypothetical protein
MFSLNPISSAVKIITDTILPKDPVTSFIEDHTPAGSLRKSFIDNVLKDKVEPTLGSVLHCSLFGVEHTGIYIGNNEIVELLGNGKICCSTPNEFIDNTNAISIYVACNENKPLGGNKIARRAKEMIGNTRDYNLLLDNCHQFTSGCIIDNFENSNNYFLFLEDIIREYLNNGDKIEWRVWDI